MFGVFIGWGIVLLWSNVCEVVWAERFVPYSLMLMEFTKVGFMEFTKVGFVGAAFSQIPASAAVLGIACYRYISIRRYL
jgi:hypothetical protein